MSLRRRSSSRAFTLIELLVVIAIIAILAAILFPVFSQAKLSAKQVVCSSNMKQLGTAIGLYMADFDDTFVPAVVVDPQPGFPDQVVYVGYDNNNLTRDNGDNGGYNGDMRLKPAGRPQRPGLIDPYLKNHQVKVCPNTPKPWQMALAANMFSSNPGFNNTTYYRRFPDRRHNEWAPMSKTLAQAPPRWFVTTTAAKAAEVDDASLTILIFEHGQRVPMCNFLQLEDWFNSPPPNRDDLKRHFNFLHRDGATVLWADTHVRRMMYGQLKRPMFSSRKDIYGS
jgi:prepilin-type N-terminal cleavage/methylation domain-containing protein/prepilin-type processing-associated H-X9-DG protein